MNRETFEGLLQRLVGDPIGVSYRVRWSNRSQTYQIEQQVGRGLFELSADPDDDVSVRARDGYFLVMAVSPSPRVKCEECGFYTEELPALKPISVTCAYCQKRGVHTHLQCAYFPLGDRLLEWLEKTSPKRGYQWQKGANERNRMLVKMKQADIVRDRDNMLTEMAPDLMGIASNTHTVPSPKKYRIES